VSWEQLRDVHDCILLMDEMTGIANARENAPLPGEVQLIVNQLRKRKVVIKWSSPSWEDATAQIRRVTRAITVCDGSWPDKAAYRAALASSEDFDEAWLPNRLFRARTWRKMGTVAEFKSKDSPHVATEYYWGPGSRSFDTYDTAEETHRIGQSNDFGTCVVCEGSRRRMECTCDDYLQRKATRRHRVEA
jgi:hypothetical protein